MDKTIEFIDRNIFTIRSTIFGIVAASSIFFIATSRHSHKIVSSKQFPTNLIKTSLGGKVLSLSQSKKLYFDFDHVPLLHRIFGFNSNGKTLKIKWIGFESKPEYLNDIRSTVHTCKLVVFDNRDNSLKGILKSRFLQRDLALNLIRKGLIKFNFDDQEVSLLPSDLVLQYQKYQEKSKMKRRGVWKELK